MITKKSKLTLISSLVFTSLIGFLNPVFADPPKDARQVAEHLEFLGFTSKIESDFLKATSPQHFPIYLEQVNSGIAFSVVFSTNANAVKNKARLMEILNRLNAEALVIKFYLDSENEIVFESPTGTFPAACSVRDQSGSASRRANSVMPRLLAAGIGI